MTAGFEMPPGDPAAMDSGLAALGGFVTDLATQSTHLHHGFTEAQARWTAPRAHDFARAATGITVQTGNARTALAGAGEALGVYLQALRKARHDIAELERQATQRLRTAEDDIDAMDDPQSPDALLTGQHASLFVAHLRDQADGVRSQLRHLAAQAADALDRATGSVVPDGADLSPDAIRIQVTAAYGVERTLATLAAAALTEEDAWATLGAAQVSAPPDDWKAWAEQYGLTVPDPLDLAHGLDLKAQLEQVLADSLALPPEQRADFLDDHFVRGLSDEDLVSLALVDPALVGNLDGLPNHVRYLANKVNVFHAVESEQARLDAWQPPPTKEDVEYVDYVRLRQRIDTLTRILADQPLSRYDTTTPKQVLAFVPPSYDGFHVTDDGRLAMVVGDLDRADHVGLVVPGITNRIDNFSATYDKALNTQDMAGPDTAAVAWLGYDTPEFHDSVTDEDALEGGRALHDFMAGLRRAEGSDLTVMAHSYGTLVTSKALQFGKDRAPIPDRIVLFGSPGLGENVHSTADLGLPPGYPIYAMRAPGDPVSITAAWGIDPVELPGITRLDTDWTDDGTEPTGHSQYTDRNTDALRNIAGVLDGIPPDQLHVGGPPLAEDGLLGRYNINLRNLVDELQAQVPSDVQSAFALQIEAELSLRIETGALTPGSPAELRDLLDLVRDAADGSGISDRLTAEEFQQAIQDAGFTDTLGDQVGDEVEHWLDEQDQLDDVVIPGPFGTRVPLPDGLNEAVGRLTGEVVHRATTRLSNWAVDHLPSLETVLDVGDVVADAWQAYDDVADGLSDAWHVVQDSPGLVADATEEFLDDAVDAGQDLVEGGEEVIDGVVDAGGDVWDKATGWLP